MVSAKELPEFAAKSTHRIGGSVKFSELSSSPPKDWKSSKNEAKTLLKEQAERVGEYQNRLYAEDTTSLLVIFQALDAAGKDSTIRRVFSEVDSAGVSVTSFKRPSTLDYQRDFLWRCMKHLPLRGSIGVFNRSYYEEVLVVRVHPEFLSKQHLPSWSGGEDIWEHRFESINNFEKHLVRNGTIILKFWLNVSLEEQAKRFLSRLDEAEKNWKFSPADVEESRLRPVYLDAYRELLEKTSSPWAPWYAIPADSKPYMRYEVTRIVAETLKNIAPKYPTISEQRQREIEGMRTEIELRVASADKDEE